MKIAVQSSQKYRIVRAFRLRLSVLFFVFALLLGQSTFGSPLESAGAERQVILGAAVDLTQEKALQKTVTVTAPGIPLSDTLEVISARYGILLHALRPVSDQRLTIVTHDLPLHDLMRQIVKTLSHAKDGSDDYEWRKTKGNGDKDEYLLVVLVSAAARQRKAQAAENERAVVLLRELRDLLRLSPDEAKKSPLAVHFTPELLDGKETFVAVFHQALRPLNDQDIDALVRGERIPVSAALLTNAVANYDREARKEYAHYMAVKKPGSGDMPVPAPTKMSGSPTLRFVPRINSEERPWQYSGYSVHLDGVFPEGIAIDPFHNAEPTLQAPATDEPILDLTAAFAPKEKDRRKQSDVRQHDLPTTLVAIAQATKINIVHEYFYKTDWGGGLIQGLPLKMQKGKATDLLNNVCRTWNYSAVKDGDVYRLWSLTWATDRDYDIAERQLKPWRKTLAAQGAFKVADQVRMATEFSWGQIQVTLKQVFLTDTVELPMDFPDSYFPLLDMLPNYSALRLQGFLSPDEQQAAASENGVPIASLNPKARDEAVHFFCLSQGIPPTESAAGTVRARLVMARLFLNPPSPALRKPHPMSVRIVAAPK